MSIIYVPRVFGGTLILTITPPSAPLPTVFVVAYFEDGNIQANFEGDF
jgi:hypothetical protein